MHIVARQISLGKHLEVVAYLILDMQKTDRAGLRRLEHEKVVWIERVPIVAPDHLSGCARAAELEGARRAGAIGKIKGRSRQCRIGHQPAQRSIRG